MPNYQNSKIYKIVSPSNPELVYYGSTTKKLCSRMAGHRTDFRKCKNNISSFEILKFDDAIILLVEKFSCNSKEELHKKEGEYILNNDCINKRVAGRKVEDRMEEYKEYQNKYREDNKDKIKNYYDEAREEIINRVKQRREQNKEAYKEYQKQYKIKNKEKLAEYMKNYRKE